MKKELMIWEWRKLWSLFMIPIFLLLCMLLNGIYLLSASYGKEYVRYVKEVTSQIGGVMGTEFDSSLAELPDNIYKEQLVFETIGVYDNLEGFQANHYKKLYSRLYSIDMEELNVLDYKYKVLQYRIDQLAEIDASLSLSGAGMTDNLADTLFSGLCRMIITEGMILAVLIALYLCGYEDMHHTVQMVYSTKVGRCIQASKIVIGMISAVASYLVIGVCSIAMFAGIWQLGDVWDSHISSQFHVIKMVIGILPFITWADFTMKTYLAAVLVVGAVLVLCFYFIGFIAGMLTSNAYKGFLIVLLGCSFLFWSLLFSAGKGCFMVYRILQWTPVALWWAQPLWFTEMGIEAVLPWQESLVALWSISFWGILLYRVYWRFQKKDIME